MNNDYPATLADAWEEIPHRIGNDHSKIEVMVRYLNAKEIEMLILGNAILADEDRKAIAGVASALARPSSSG